MNERERNILDAATTLFMRYGVKRTSMNDISQEAGISRQTLYNAYRNKDEILRALIRYFADRAYCEIEAGLEEKPALGDRLDLVFDRIAVAAFDLLSESPNAADLVEGFNQISEEEIDASYAQVRGLIATILKPYASEIEANGLTTTQLADFVQRMVKASKSTATDRAHLLEMLQTLKTATLKLAGVA
ncbi:TetR/AcrR family transcriptional regulator [Aliiruegeria lutimaris]|nr:TetR/AcrR family transcriptional regulator [Aliiruegeria lutimaris]